MQSHAEIVLRPPLSHRGRILAEIAIVYGATVLLCVLLWRLRQINAFVETHLATLFAGLFLFLPTELLRYRKENFSDYGLTWGSLRQGLTYFSILSLVCFPCFCIAGYGYYRVLCPAAPRIPWMPRNLVEFCRYYRPHRPSWSGFDSIVNLARMTLIQLLVVALPEEYFFRGYLQTRIQTLWPSRIHWHGIEFGNAIWIAALLFSIGHLMMDLDFLRLAVFFPALLFGWLRQETQSIFAGVLFHASSNLVSDGLHRVLFDSLR